MNPQQRDSANELIDAAEEKAPAHSVHSERKDTSERPWHRRGERLKPELPAITWVSSYEKFAKE
jgi:hypothetical protein